MKAELPWFRMYADAIDDEKLRLLSFEDRWHFVAILCCKRKGILDTDDSPALLRRKMAVKLGLAARELDAMADRLGELGLIDPETFQPAAWDQRQFKSDTSKERVRAHRERMKQGCNVTETDASVSVTASAGDVVLALEAIAAKTSGFADWWAVYPHKTGRKPCEAKWKAAGLDAIADTLIADTLKRATKDSGWLGGYVPNPLTYLNQERWNDDLRAAPVARPAASAPSKTLGAMQTLQGIRHGLAGNRTAERTDQVALLGAGSDPGE